MRSERITPNSMARDLEVRIAELELERDALPRSERRPLNKRLHVLRGLLRWCRTRAGYVA